MVRGELATASRNGGLAAATNPEELAGLLKAPAGVFADDSIPSGTTAEPGFAVEAKHPPGFRTDWRSINILTIVGFLGSLQIGMMNFNLWAYITELEPTMTTTFYGYMLSIASATSVIITFATGYISNRLSSSTPALMMGKAASIAACTTFLLVEVATEHRREVFLFMQVLFGASYGLMSVSRAQVSSSSAEEDRPRGVAMLSLSVTVGFAFGPLLMTILTLLKYPGLPLLGGLHLNLYTFPGYFMICCGITALVLLCTCYNGTLVEAPTSAVELDSTSGEEPLPFDWVAVIICCGTRLTYGLTLVYLSSISGAYMMATFRWSGDDFVFYQSLMTVVNGVTGTVISLGYMYGFMQKRLSSRQSTVIGLTFLLGFYVLTYQYPFLADKMGYQVLERNAANQEIIVEHGCRANVEWCAETPATNVYLYCIAFVVGIGVACPMGMLNTEILYAMVLGPIKQGTMQGVFIVCTDLLNVFGPIFFTTMYDASGPRYLWWLNIGGTALTLLVWIVFYDRMVSYSEMSEKRRVLLQKDNGSLQKTALVE